MIKKIFWRGIKATVPLVITFALVIWAFSVIEYFFGSIIKGIFGDKYYFEGLGFLLGILIVFSVGVFINLWIVQGVYGIGEKILKKIPIIKTIYNSIEDMMSFFDPTKKGQKGKPVLIDTDLGKVIAFVTIDKPELLPEELRKDDQIAVYIPLSYQIGGITVLRPRSQVQQLNMPIDQAMSFVLTAGMTGKGEKNEPDA